MQLPAEYQAPEELADHSFVRDTAKAKLLELRQINARLADAMTPVVSAKKHPGKAVKLQSSKAKVNLHADDEDDTSDISDLMG